MFHQLYILARGGVCVFSGNLSQIEGHLRETFSEGEPEKVYPYPMDELIKHACNDYRHEAVQRLAKVNEARRKAENADEEEVPGGKHLQRAVDGIPRNRARFSARSVLALAARYFAYIRGHLWKLYFLVAVTYLSYGSVLSLVFPSADIATVSGCYDPEEDFNNTCAKSEEDINKDLMLEDNLRYTFLAQLVYLLLVAFCAAISFNGIFKYFVLEHRNGKLLVMVSFFTNLLLFQAGILRVSLF